MINTTDIEAQAGRKVADIKLKEGFEDVYVVVFDNNLMQRWQCTNEKWTCLG